MIAPWSSPSGLLSLCVVGLFAEQEGMPALQELAA